MLLKRIRQCGWIGLVLLLHACGGPEAHSDFVIKQPARFVGVVGLPYQSGANSGTTDSAGNFDLEVTVPTCNNCQRVASGVTFNLMKDVPLPGAGTAPTLPPLLSGASYAINAQELHDTLYLSAYTVSADPIVQKNVMLALAIVDADGDPTNGIQIPAAVANGTFGSTVPWSSTNPTVDFAEFVAKVQALDPSGKHNFPTDSTVLTAHFAATWSCALTGRLSGQLNNPMFTNTSGSPQSFLGSWAAAVTPTGVLGRLSFSAAPFQFDGQFRFSGPLQAAQLSTATTTSVQYVDGGQFAPQTSPQLTPPLSAQISFTGTATATGTWTGDTYSGGQLQGGVRQESSTNNNNTTVYQPFTGSTYRFLQYPIWNKTGDQVFHLEADPVHADGTHTVWAYVALLDAKPVTNPPTGTIAANNTLSIQQTNTNVPTGYDWKFDGTYNPIGPSWTGTLSLSDGTIQQWGLMDPWMGCGTL
jgi:hypothetical protein